MGITRRISAVLVFLSCLMYAGGAQGVITLSPTEIKANNLTVKKTPYADLKAWGAKCDGVTDDATAIQAAITYALSANVELRAPAGTCLTSAKLSVTLSSDSIKGFALIGQGRGRTIFKYTGAAAVGSLIEVSKTGTYGLNVNLKGFEIDLTGAPTGTIGLKINAGVWRSWFDDLYITRDVPAGVRTGTGIYMGSATPLAAGSYDNKFTRLYISHFSKNLHFQGTDLSGNTITNTAIDHSYISDGDYNLYAEYFNGLSANNTQIESAQTAGTYFVWGETAIFTGGSIESAVAGAKGIDMDANTRSVIALCDFFNNTGGHFTANGQIGHLYKSSNSGFVYVPGSEIRMDKDASYTSYIRFFKNGVADVRMKTGASGDTLGITNSAGTEHFSFDATNAVLNLNTATGVLRLHSGAAISFYQGGIDVKWLVGLGTPEGFVTAPVGSLYTRTDGGAGTTLYVKQSGAGNIGWVAK